MVAHHVADRGLDASGSRALVMGSVFALLIGGVCGCGLDIIGGQSDPDPTPPAPSAPSGSPSDPANPSGVLTGSGSVNGGPNPITHAPTGNPYVDAVLAKNPLVYYRFEEKDGSSAIDTSGHNLIGTYHDVSRGEQNSEGGKKGDEQSTTNVGVSQVLGAAGRFDPEKRSNLAVPSLGSQTKISIECWVNPKSIGSATDNHANTIYGVDGFPTAAARFQLASGIMSNDDVLLSVNNNNPLNVNATGGGSIATDTWSYVVTTYDPQTGAVLFYVNGVLNGLGGFFINPNPTLNLTAGHIGGEGGTSQLFDGSIDELAIYGDVLSPQEIAQHYAAAGL